MGKKAKEHRKKVNARNEKLANDKKKTLDIMRNLYSQNMQTISLTDEEMLDVSDQLNSDSKKVEAK